MAPVYTGGGAGQSAGGGGNVHAAWAALMRSLGIGTANAVNRSRAGRKRLRRVVR